MATTTVGETQSARKLNGDPLKVVEKYMTELGQNGPALITIAVVLTLLGITVAFFSARSTAKDNQAKNALFLAMKTLDDETKAATPPAPKVLPSKDKKA